MVDNLIELQRIDVEISEILKSGHVKKREKKNHERNFKRKLNVMKKTRMNLVDSLDNVIVKRYEKLRGFKGDTSAVVPVRNKICQGCFIEISTATYVVINRKDIISTCDHCGCFIYLDA